MSEQLELIKAKGPKVTPEEISALVAVIRDRGWLTASEITRTICWPDRKIRAVANASEGQIISGQSGYKLTNQATIEEIEHAANWLRHQASEMTHRALQIDRIRHGKLPNNADQTTKT